MIYTSWPSANMSTNDWSGTLTGATSVSSGGGWRTTVEMRTLQSPHFQERGTIPKPNLFIYLFIFFSLTCKRTITHITLRSHNWLNIVTSVGFLIRPFQRREIKLKSKDSSKANFWVARLQIFMEKALLKKPCWDGGRGLYMTPYHFGIPTPVFWSGALGYSRLTGTGLGQNQQAPHSLPSIWLLAQGNLTDGPVDLHWVCQWGLDRLWFFQLMHPPQACSQV